jgi:hypothetical protein
MEAVEKAMLPVFIVVDFELIRVAPRETDANTVALALARTLALTPNVNSVNWTLRKNPPWRPGMGEARNGVPFTQPHPLQWEMTMQRFRPPDRRIRRYRHDIEMRSISAFETEVFASKRTLMGQHLSAFSWRRNPAIRRNTLPKNDSRCRSSWPGIPSLPFLTQ